MSTIKIANCVNISSIANEIYSSFSKYLTYGHAWNQANEKPIWELHEDMALGVNCAKGIYDKGMPFKDIQG